MRTPIIGILNKNGILKRATFVLSQFTRVAFHLRLTAVECGGEICACNARESNVVSNIRNSCSGPTPFACHSHSQEPPLPPGKGAQCVHIDIGEPLSQTCLLGSKTTIRATPCYRFPVSQIYRQNGPRV